MKKQFRKMIALVCALLTLFASIGPARAGDPADDLKQIEYKYYFRGKYPEAIEALQTFLAREGLSNPTKQRAGEFLAASYVLAGLPDAGKDAFLRIMVANPAYAGPDAAVFKPEVMDVYASARAEYKPLTLHEPAVAATDSVAGDVPPASGVQTVSSKPIYKKWWFYAGAAAVAIAVGAAAGGGGGDDSNPRAAGTVVVGVNVK